MPGASSGAAKVGCIGLQASAGARSSGPYRKATVRWPNPCVEAFAHINILGGDRGACATVSRPACGPTRSRTCATPFLSGPRYRYPQFPRRTGASLISLSTAPNSVVSTGRVAPASVGRRLKSWRTYGGSMLRIRFSGGLAGQPTGAASRVRPLVHNALIVAALTAAVMLVSVSSALAVSGIAVNVGTPYESQPPAIAVDAAGDAIVAWANTKDLPPHTTKVLQYCVLPVGATGCVHSNTLVPADGGEYIDRVQVLVDGSTIVLLADVYGTQGPKARDYEPEQEWQSTDGGATFSHVNGGVSGASGILTADTKPLSAVIVPGTGVLGYGWDTAGSSPPTFNAFPLNSPPECSTETCPAGFASLEPNTTPDQLGNDEGQFAAQNGPNAGVMGVFKTDFTNGPLGCSSSETVPFGTAYAFASGPQAVSNNYNISPGEANSAWKVAVAQADCNVEYFALAGGPSGFGVLEDNDLTKSIVYHRFDQATDTFDTPLATIAANAFEESPTISQDASGGIYATFLLGGPGGQI